MAGGLSTAARFMGGFFEVTGVNHRYLVVIDDERYNLGSWSRVSGLGVTWQVCEYRAGDSNDVHTFVGAPTYSRIRLSRAVCFDSQVVQEWLCQQARRYQPLSGSIQLVDSLGIKIVGWELKHFFPVGWSVSELDPSRAGVAVETLELAHTGFLDDDVSFSL
ncbi:phage tail protein [Micromonospora sp. NPDC049460]|uniref:phage tail protein n=1 Tax=unclassified Micromonospora TaxID=2617518 RepID=UPI003722E2E6